MRETGCRLSARENHHGSKSLRGKRVAAIFYSLIESAKLAGVEPSAYIREAAGRVVEAPDTAALPSSLRER